MAGAIDSTRSFGSRLCSGTGTVLVHTTSSTSGWAASLPSAPSANSPWVQAMRTERTSCSRSRASSSVSVVPRAISSSMTMKSRPVTSPMIALIVTESSP